MDGSDPIFSALARLEAANAETSAKQSELGQLPHVAAEVSRVGEQIAGCEDATEAAVCERLSRLEQLYATEPTSLSGLAALVRVFLTEDIIDIQDTGLPGLAVQTICRSVLTLAKGEATRSGPEGAPGKD
jgi:hypothetical protein